VSARYQGLLGARFLLTKKGTQTMSATQPKELTADLERKAWDLRMKCWSHFEIADELRITEKEVARLLKRMADKFAKAFLEEIHQMRVEQTAQLQQIAKAAFQAWEAAQQPTNPSPPPEESLPDPGQNGQTPSLPPSREKEPESEGSSPGDPPKSKIGRPSHGAAYLRIALQAFAAIRALWGLNQPPKAEVAQPEPWVETFPHIDMERFMRKDPPTTVRPIQER